MLYEGKPQASNDHWPLFVQPIEHLYLHPLSYNTAGEGASGQGGINDYFQQ